MPLGHAVPFGLQHILAMFVANIAPIIIVANACKLSNGQIAMLIQSAMLIAGIGTLIQLFPIWRVGSGLPIVMGISFTFVSILCFIGTTYGYETIVGAVLVGGILEGTLGLFAKYWLKWISPIVVASVVTAIGFSLLSVGSASFGGGSGSANFGSVQNWIIGTVTLLSCILFNLFAKSYFKQLSVLFGLVVGYILAVCMHQVDFSALANTSIIAFPHIMPFKMEFNLNAIVSVTLIFLVSATETIGDTSALASSGLNRDVTVKETTGSIACDGFVSALSACFGCLPITSFSQNVGLVAMTKVVNRFAIATGAVIMILAGIFPIFGAVLATLPDSVLGGCTIMMFGTICSQWYPDDWKMWIYPEKHYYSCVVLKRGNRFYPGAGDFCDFSSDCAKCICSELRSSSLFSGCNSQSGTAEKYGSKSLKILKTSRCFFDIMLLQTEMITFGGY